MPINVKNNSRQHEPRSLYFASLMRASLSLNPDSFTRRFAMIPCAAGSIFQTVDVMMNTPSNTSNSDWGVIFVNSSQQKLSDVEDGNIIRCKNCRSVTRTLFFVLTSTLLTPRVSSAATRFDWMT
jgi:hypothetical protein